MGYKSGIYNEAIGSLLILEGHENFALEVVSFMVKPYFYAFTLYVNLNIIF